jgi:hypothetical protein
MLVMSKLLVAALLLPVAASQSPLVLRPVDEAPRSRDFLAFRTKLQHIVDARDVSGLLSVVHPDIKNSFGGDDGKEAFKRLWRLENPRSDVWKELAWILAHGGRFDGLDSFVAPYVFSNWPEEVDPFEHVAVVGSNVRVRLHRSTNSRILDTVSFRILPRGRDVDDSADAWTSVVLPDGRSGFVAPGLSRSPIYYRAYFTRTGDVWQMTVLIAGD